MLSAQASPEIGIRKRDVEPAARLAARRGASDNASDRGAGPRAREYDLYDRRRAARMIRTLFMTAACVAAACASPASPAKAPSRREAWNAPAEPFRVVDRVYYVGTAGLASYLFEARDGLILLDGALPESAPAIEAHIARLGFELSQVKILLNSHAHFDHSGGLARLKKDTGAKLYAMEGDVSALEGGFYLGSEADASLRAPPVKVDGVLHDGDVVALGDLSLRATATPGHSRGCTSWRTTVHEGSRSLELIVFCSATVAGNRITPPLQYPGIVEDYRATFAKAKEMHVDVFLAPHPEFFDLGGKRARMTPGAPNPFVAPGEFRPFVEKLEAEFEETLAERTRRNR